MAPSSSGPGRLVLIQKIAGSTPAGVTRELKKTFRSFFDSLNDFCQEIETRETGSHRAPLARDSSLPQESPTNKKEGPKGLVFLFIDSSVGTEPAKQCSPVESG